MDMVDELSIQIRYAEIVARIRKAARKAGRSPDEIRLMVVSKTQPAAAIRAAFAAGARRFGENYAEEAVTKMATLADLAGLEWHMIGHIQSRKAGLVVSHFNYVHSLDSLKLAERLNRLAAEQEKRIPVLLECNPSGEESKFGFPAWQEARWQELLPDFEKILTLPHLEVRGLMGMAPFFDEAEPARPYFRKLRKLREALAGWFPNAIWDELSMGMSGDFEVAIEEGATWVRIGQRILGARPVFE